MQSQPGVRKWLILHRTIAFSLALEDGFFVQSVTVLPKDCSSARDCGDILCVDDTLDSVQCSAIRESPSLVTL